jgi:hypothetical protein
MPRKKELTPEVEKLLEDTLKPQLEAAYLRGLKAGCKTMAAYCIEIINKHSNKIGVAVYQIRQFCNKTLTLPDDKVEPVSGTKE